MKNSRRSFLRKGPIVAVAAGVGVASGRIAVASPADPSEGTRPLLDAFLAGQRQANGKLYAASDLLLQVLRMMIPLVPIDVAVANAKLNEAEGYIDAIPIPDPPGCELPPGFGGY